MKPHPSFRPQHSDLYTMLQALAREDRNTRTLYRVRFAIAAAIAAVPFIIHFTR